MEKKFSLFSTDESVGKKLMPLCPPDKGKLDPIGLRNVDKNVPQLFIDDYLIESRFDSRMLAASVPHVLHVPEHPDEPVLCGTEPWETHGVSHPGILYDPRDRLFRMYYTVSQDERNRPGYPPGVYFICYAESRDGINWEKPRLGLVPWGDIGETNILLQGDQEAKIAHVHTSDESPETGSDPVNIGTIPPEFLRNHRFVMFYGDGPHYLATSEDGRNWKEKEQLIIANRIDCYQTIVYDEFREEFVIYLRNKLIFGDVKKYGEGLGGNTRMISRLAGRDLWSELDTMPVSVIIPDQGDGMRFYALPTFRYGGIYWGMLQHLNEGPQSMETELVTSRDGLNWNRPGTSRTGKPHLIAVGEPGTWDCGMVMSSDRIIEVGDEWWLYYAGYDGYHDSYERTAGIGLMKLRREGFISVRAGDSDSYLLTRPFHWPGGELSVNINASKGFLQARVTDQRRNTIDGFDYASSRSFEGDATRHRITWENGVINRLEGQLIRLELKFRNADLYSFTAAG